MCFDAVLGEGEGGMFHDFRKSAFVPLPYCLYDCKFVVQSEVRQVDSSSSIPLSQHCFGSLRFFVFFIKIVELFLTVH